MDPITAAGIALSIAGLAGQVFMGCIQGIQFIITAKNLPEESKYLNLRLRMEQQRLFAWSETSGLLDFQNKNEAKVKDSNTFVIHRTTILDLLVQIQCLFQEFEKAQTKNQCLKVSSEPVDPGEEVSLDPAKDSSIAHVPLSEPRKNFILKAMKAVKSTKETLNEGRKRLLWAAFDREAFEDLLHRFSTLNDNMTDILDARLQTEIHRTTQDTNRGVLQLHKDLKSLRQLVEALNIKTQARAVPTTTSSQYNSASDANGLRLLAQLAKFKAFNESLDEKTPEWDQAAAKVLQLHHSSAELNNMRIDRSSIILEQSTSDIDHTAIRCEAFYVNERQKQHVWIEWKEYDHQPSTPDSPPPLIISRVQKLASLLHHTPKPEAFRVPHCLGYFDAAQRLPGSGTESEEDEVDTRIGFVFEKPQDENVDANTPPISLFELLSTSPKPRVTDRVKVAHAIANCLLYLHSVNWLHKGLRSHNIVFFPTKAEGKRKIDYSKPYVSGFDFARPARSGEVTEVPNDNDAYNMYRHPLTQSQDFGPRESFRKSFDIYSLGIVLVELAHWNTIEKILRLEDRRTRMRLTPKIRETMLHRSRVDEIGSNMGELYEEATRKCISGGEELGVGEHDDETNDVVASRLSMRFYEDVVRKLSDIKV